MPELDAFERSLEAAFGTFAERGVVPVDAVAFAERVAGQPRARRWPMTLGATPRLAWVLLAAALLLATLLAAVGVGGWLADRRLAAVPPMPSPLPAATVIADAADVLATTKARPLPAQATCPPGSDPDAPGAVDQDRPTGGELAFDRHAGMIVALAPDGGTWAYEVCTNTWQRKAVAPIEGYWPLGYPSTARLVYDADSDRTLAFDGGVIWSYELAADRWTKAGAFPMVAGNAANETFGTIFYHDPSGLVVVYDGADMWAYDVDANTLAMVRQRPDPSLPADSGLPQGRIALAYDPGHDLAVAVVAPYLQGSGARGSADRGYRPATRGQTWTFDPGTGTWHLADAEAATDLIVCSYFVASRDCRPSPGRAVFDEASGLTAFLTRDGTSGRIRGYDAGEDAWRTLHGPTVSPTSPTWCDANPPVYDPLNDRIVCLAPAAAPDIFGWGAPFAGVWAFSSTSGESRWLLEPADQARCDVGTVAGKAGEAGAADGVGTAARFSEPHAIVAGAGGAFFITDTANGTIRRMTPDGAVTTFAGAPGEPGFADGVGTAARFAHPTGIAIDASGTLYIADTGNDAIRTIAPDGTVATLARGLGVSPIGLAVADNVYAGGREGNVILRISPDGTITTLAGKRGQPGSADGVGSDARFGSLGDIQLIRSGNDDGSLAVIDTASDGTAALRIVTLDGTVRTPTTAEWTANGPLRAIWTGDIPYVVAAGDTIVTLTDAHVSQAGRAGEAGYEDGRNESVRFREPTGIARGDPGRFYIVDSGNDVIRTMACIP